MPTSRLLRKFGPLHDNRGQSVCLPGGGPPYPQLSPVTIFRRTTPALAAAPRTAPAPTTAPAAAATAAARPAPSEDDEQEPSQQRERREDQHDPDRPPGPDAEHPEDPEQQQGREQDAAEHERAHRVPRLGAPAGVTRSPLGSAVPDTRLIPRAPAAHPRRARPE